MYAESGKIARYDFKTFLILNTEGKKKMTDIDRAHTGHL